MGATGEDDVEVVPKEGEEEGVFGVVGRFEEEGLVVGFEEEAARLAAFSNAGGGVTEGRTGPPSSSSSR